ncbi:MULTISPECIES: bifunctional precorrin-2 dehydrogenase/sirohydrochlorin ferrochelatase [unclassified Thermoplasma]|uniref:precorrin-2 dehydrogenase/sirohydrochlorin ferrochelatase family protein n=1 Tax=unclassified Thermoplasma TaxID=2684908 RepID=UPI001F2084A4|nr:MULTISPECIES: bifunctional precorrin-2 dehydrogenase/sirohydrochlorin ferrochelatase [unclassified Thermoplasma]
MDIKLDRHPLVFIGHGHEFDEKIVAFSQEASIIYAFTDERIVDPHVSVVSGKFEDGIETVRDVRPIITFISTEDEVLDAQLASMASLYSTMVYIPDRVMLSDINLCALIKKGPVSIGISTKGKSPAMTVMIKKRLNACIDKYGIITREDALMIDFISRNRTKIISGIRDRRRRRVMMYKIAVDRNMRSMVASGTGDPDKMLESLIDGQ